MRLADQLVEVEALCVPEQIVRARVCDAVVLARLLLFWAVSFALEHDFAFCVSRLYNVNDSLIKNCGQSFSLKACNLRLRRKLWLHR
jgi:hypothetical protein